jgi:fatty acid desaturase
MTQCCNDFGQCTQGADCPARANSLPPFQCSPMREKSPQKELASDAVYFVGYIALLVVICATAGFAWDMLQHFAPNLAFMLIYLFS